MPIPPAPTWVSIAAETLHPGLRAALESAGIATVPGGGTGTLAVIAAGEDVPGTDFVRVARARVPSLARAGGARCRATLGFAAADMRFAAALTAAIATGDDPVAADPASQALVALAARVASRDVTVLINGPTGTGKEVLAGHIHRRSPRRDHVMVAVNCAALPEAMLEAVLFGHERGAFSGAVANARGLFRAADGGTLLLDEIAELPLALQAKLLRALQEREVLSIGALFPHKIDVRIIACANRDLAAEVAAGRFRADLFYRLAVFPIATQPLCNRRADIVAIAAALWMRAGGGVWPTAEALARLEAHAWPGNVRELDNVLQRASVYATGDRIQAGDIVFDAGVLTPAAALPAATLGGMVREREFAAIRAALADCAGRRSETAHRLGISERTLRYKLAAMGGSADAQRMTMQ